MASPTLDERAAASFSGAVLTGGASSRMGRDKAFVEIDGRPMASVARRALVQAGATTVFAVGGDLDRLRRIGLTAIPDTFPGEGPLGGIIDALSHAPDEIVVVLACDHPSIESALVARLLDSMDDEDQAAIPLVHGTPQPLAAAYRRSALALLRAAFASGERSPRRALGAIGWSPVLDVEARWIDDVDDAEDLARYASGRNEPTGDEVSIHVDVNEISVHTLDEYRQAGAPLIDVRQPDEYTEAHVPGAKLIPMDQLPEQIEQIPTDTPVYLICATGVRSYRAAEWLTAQGFDASNVSGGTRAWIEAGKAVVAGPDPD